MKTILAHWKKDLASVRTLFIVWLVCVALVVAFYLGGYAGPGYVASFLGDSSGALGGMAVFMALVTGIIGVLGLQFLFVAILIVRIVQLDSLVDPNAWWRTRPISGLNLLAAKTLSVVVLLIGAVLCLAVIGFSSHIDSKDLDPQALKFISLSSVLSVAVFVTGLIAFAALTKDLSSLILNWLAVAIGAVVLASIIQALWRHFFATVDGAMISVAPHFNAAARVDSPSLSLLYLAGFLAAIFCQYLKRSTNASRAILFATFLLVFLVKG